MLYSEFVAGTGCRENKYNYKVYCDLEVMYMHTDLTKEEIYAYGRKLVDNSKPQEIIDLENKLKEKEKELKENIKAFRELASFYDRMGNTSMAKSYRQRIREMRCEVRSIKFVLSD